MWRLFLLLHGLQFAFVSPGFTQIGSRLKTNRFWLGADLSYVNELEDCKGKWLDNQIARDPFVLFSDKGCSVVRVRIWHNPKWTHYSTLQDVKKTIRRSKKLKMRVLLDIHYSDTWADPGHQEIPHAWKGINDLTILGDSVFNYTYSILNELGGEDLNPDIVQVGNEINTEVMQSTEKASPKINWKRNAYLLNRGLSAVTEFSKKTRKPIETMLHIAQPDSAFLWFEIASKNGVSTFDWIGLSYYSQWSKFDLHQLGAEIKRLKINFKKRVMVVEAGYPFSLVNIDSADNIFDTTSQLPGYQISKIDQRRFMVDMTKTVLKNGGEGVIYWEPAWISTPCRTKWGKGSHYENAIFFDPEKGNEALPVFDFFDESNYE